MAADSRHPALKADYILANPPFNVSDWGAERLKDDQRWRFGTPPKGQRQLRLGGRGHRGELEVPRFPAPGRRSTGMIDYGKFRLSPERLREQYANYRQLDLALPEVTREAVAESVVHRFETCYDCAPNSPKPVFRLAFENRLLDGPVERWLGYADHRVGTAHDYSLSKAEDCLAATGDFIADERSQTSLRRSQ